MKTSVVCIIFAYHTVLKYSDNHGNQNERHHPLTNSTTISMTSLDVSDEELHKNISYRALAPLQLSVAASRVKANHGGSIKMTQNRSYPTGGYEYVY